MGRAIGHYARWIRPGAVRIDATSDDPLVQVTAFRDDAQGRLVLVAINNATAARRIAVGVANGPAMSGALAGEQSTAGAVWAPISGTTTAASWAYDLPAQSVTTMVGAIPVVTPPGGDAGTDPPNASGGCCDSGSSPSGGALALVVVCVFGRRSRRR